MPINCGELYESDITASSSTFYSNDRLGTDPHHYGNTLFHRLRAMHAPAVALKNFLDLLGRHHDRVANIKSGNFQSIMPHTMAENFESMPPPPSVYHQNKDGLTARYLPIYRNPWQTEPIVRTLMEAEISTLR